MQWITDWANQISLLIWKNRVSIPSQCTMSDYTIDLCSRFQDMDETSHPWTTLLKMINKWGLMNINQTPNSTPNCQGPWDVRCLQGPTSSNSKWICVVSMTTLHDTGFSSSIKREQFSYKPSFGGRFNKHDFGADTLCLLLVNASWYCAVNIRRCWRPKSSETYFMSPMERAWRTRVDETCPLSFELLEAVFLESWLLSMTGFIM